MLYTKSNCHPAIYRSLVQVSALLIILIIFSSACNPDPATDTGSRSYYMSFTPFPYAISQEAVNFTYNTLKTDADMVTHAFDEGIPWPEALSGAAFSQNIADDWQNRKQKTPAGHKIFIQITPINFERNGLALYRGTGNDMPLPAPWDGYTFNNQNVKDAYYNYCERVIAYFNPDFLSIGIEVNLLMANTGNQALWEAYCELHTYVYAKLKTAHPNLPIFVSFAGMYLYKNYWNDDQTAAYNAQIQCFNDLIAKVDYFGISLYPYMSKYMTAALPPLLFEELCGLTTKPVAITETGYPGETFSITNPALTFTSDEDKQNAYITLLLDKAGQYSFKFVNNYILRDYDALLTAIGWTDVGAAWVKTGLYNDDGTARKGLATLKAKLQLPIEAQ